MTRSLVLTALSVLALACGSQRLSVGADSEREPAGGTAGTTSNTFPNSANGGSGAISSTATAWAGSGATAVDTSTNRCPRLDSAGLIDWAAYHAACTPECTCEPFLGVLAGGMGGPGNVDGVGANARFGFYGSMAGIVRDDAGNLFVSELRNQTIRRFNIATGTVVTLAGASGISGSTDGVGASARFAAPKGLALDGAGNLFVADNENRTIRKVVIATAEVTTFAGTAGESAITDGIGAAARFESPAGLVADHEGNLFLSDGDKIRKIVIATGAVTTIAGGSGGGTNYDGIGNNATFYRPNGLTLDQAGNLFVADTDNFTIRKIELNTGTVTTLTADRGWASIHEGGPQPPSAARFWAPGAVVADAAGNLFVADSGNARICRVDIATGALSTLAGSREQQGSTDGRGLDATFLWPAGLALDDAGDLLVVDTEAFTIRKIAIGTGDVTTLAGRAPNDEFRDGVGVAARFSKPGAMAYDGKGRVLVVDEGDGEIRRIDLADGSVTTVAEMEGEDDCDYESGSWSGFDGIAVDQDGTVYFADSVNGLIKRIDPGTGVVTIVGPGCREAREDPAKRLLVADLVVDGAGHLFAAANETIRRVDLATGASTIIAGSPGIAGSVDGASDVARLHGPTGLALDRRGILFVADSANSVIRSIDLATGVVATVAGVAGVVGSSDGIGNAASFYIPTDVALDDLGNLFVTDTGNHSVRKIVLQSRSVSTVVGSSNRYGATLGPLPASLNSPEGVLVGPSGELLISDSTENSVFFVHL